MTILAIAIAWLIVSGFACIVAGKFFAAGNPGDDSADQLADGDWTVGTCTCGLNLPCCDSRMCPADPVSARFHAAPIRPEAK